MLWQELAHKNREVITRTMERHRRLKMKEIEFERARLVSSLLQDGDAGASVSVSDAAVGTGKWTQPQCPELQVKQTSSTVPTQSEDIGNVPLQQPTTYCAAVSEFQPLLPTSVQGYNLQAVDGDPKEHKEHPYSAYPLHSTPPNNQHVPRVEYVAVSNIQSLASAHPAACIGIEDARPPSPICRASSHLPFQDNLAKSPLLSPPLSELPIDPANLVACSLQSLPEAIGRPPPFSSNVAPQGIQSSGPIHSSHKPALPYYTAPAVYPPPGPAPVPYLDLLIASSYGVPKPTLPTFESGKESDFALLKMALDNLMSNHKHLNEQYKYQVLIGPLQAPECLETCQGIHACPRALHKSSPRFASEVWPATPASTKRPKQHTDLSANQVW